MDEIRFFDANAVIGKTSIPRDSLVATPEELIRDMAKIRLNKALVFHTEALNDPVFGNRMLISQVADHKELVGCAVLAPNASGEFGDIGEYFQYLAVSGIKAIRLFPQIHFYTLKPYVLSGILEQAALWHMPVFIDCVPYTHLSVISTWDLMPDYDSIYELAMAWPEVSFILVIPGMTNQRQQYAILDACDNVCLETSGYAYRFIENVCLHFSARRLIAGSYMPRSDPSAMMLGVLYANISDSEKQMIAGGNLEALISQAGKTEECI